MRMWPFLEEGAGKIPPKSHGYISLVPSSNGLGHARRLAFLASGFQELGYEVRLLTTDIQRARLLSEFPETDLVSMTLPDTLQFDLEGPSRGLPESQIIGEIPPVVQEFLQGSFACISDNVVWPHLQSARGLILANFLWSDYWETRLKISPAITRQRMLEEKAMERGVTRVVNPLVAWTSPGSRFFPRAIVPFLRYPNDRLLRDLARGNEVMIVGGTTHLEDSWLDQLERSLMEAGLTAVRVESWEMKNLKILPYAMIGRPGLGSIRDSMASGVPFVPAFSDVQDPEMIWNARLVTKKISGDHWHYDVWNDTALVAKRVSHLFEDRERVRVRVSSAWDKISEEPHVVAKRILSML